MNNANADRQIARAKAEARRAMAVALEQEMPARVVEADAEVPRDLAVHVLVDEGETLRREIEALEVRVADPLGIDRAEQRNAHA